MAGLSESNPKSNHEGTRGRTDIARVARDTTRDGTEKVDIFSNLIRVLRNLIASDHQIRWTRD
jgi:hypothetical protein